RTYVNVYMKRKKDCDFDSIDSIHKSPLLKQITSVKNFMISSSSSSSSPDDDYSVPISALSKRGDEFGIGKIKVARFLRNHPSFFEEFTGPLHGLPWFRLSRKAIDLDSEERCVYEESGTDIVVRLMKMILMSPRKILPLKLVKEFQWYLGLPDQLLNNLPDHVPGYGSLRIVEDMDDGFKGIQVVPSDGAELLLSVMQKNAIDRGGECPPTAFPLFPSRGLRLKHKIKDWLGEFQKLPYVSPYEDPSGLSPGTDLSEKRVVGLLHEALSLFVEHSARRKAMLSTRKYFGLPQKLHRAFERHPYIFYLSLKNNTCTAVLREAYCDEGAVEPHPLAGVRKKYVALVEESVRILRNRRSNKG
ncbi:hypothetical protein M569_15153, partial [Genlisea aurea]